MGRRQNTRGSYGGDASTKSYCLVWILGRRRRWSVFFHHRQRRALLNDENLFWPKLNVLYALIRKHKCSCSLFGNCFRNLRNSLNVLRFASNMYVFSTTKLNDNCLCSVFTYSSLFFSVSSGKSLDVMT